LSDIGNFGTQNPTNAASYSSSVTNKYNPGANGSPTVNVLGTVSGFETNSFYRIIPPGTLFLQGSPATGVTTAVSAGGTVSVGTHVYNVVAIDLNGGQCQLSVDVTATTTTGNQTVTLNWTSVPFANQGYLIYRDGNLVNSIPATTTSFVDNGVTTGGASVDPSAGGPVGISSALGVWSQQYVTGSGNFNTFKTTAVAASLTGNRTTTWPDISGITIVSSYQNSAYDPFNRVNGAVGSNWTTITGLSAPQISGNQVLGQVGTQQAAFWNANTFAADQFAQVIVSNQGSQPTANGTGVWCRASGGNGYLFQASNNVLQIFKYANPTFTQLGSNVAATVVGGDVLRFECSGTTLKGTQVGSASNSITQTDSTFTSGSPGIWITGPSGTPPSEDNWSGGNLHPIAQLDTEQDWTQPQHFISPVTIGSPAPVAGTLVQGNVGTAVVNIASGTATMTTAAIAGGACGTTVTVAGAGITTADAITWSFAASVGINPGELNVTQWPTAGNVNFQYCNETGASVTPTATTINWRVTR
jgi:hypothetical protein